MREDAAAFQALIGQSVQAIDTPALVIDLDAMERNLQRMQAYADAQGVKLRPHAKMHKSATLAKLQMQAGAVGVCVQKVTEMQRLAQLGVGDIYLSNAIISLQKCELIPQILRAKNAESTFKNDSKLRLSVAFDSLQGIQNMAQAMQSENCSQVLDAFIEIDVGHGRCGVAPGQAAVPLALEIARHTSLRFAGLQAYHGKAQHLRKPQERHQAIEGALDAVRQTIAALHAAGIEVPLVTGAGTGSFIHEAASGIYGELQAGSYLFMDADYAANDLDAMQDGIQSPRFEHALFVKSSVMSRQTRSGDDGGEDRAIVDAGHKSHAIDSGLPKVWSAQSPQATHWQFFNGGDEHGILRGAALPDLGQTVWLIPGHCDPTVNLHDAMIGVRGGLHDGVVEQIIAVDTRGCIR